MKKLVKYSVLVFMFIISIILIVTTSTPDLSLEAEEYDFAISTGDMDQGNLHDLFLEYDFNSNSGKFSFEMFNKEKIGRLDISFPEQIIIRNHNITNEEGDSPPACSIMGNHPGIICNDIEAKSSLRFNITMASNKTNKFYPNGVFYFHSPFTESSAKYFRDSHSNDLIHFNFGDEYRCSERCFLGEFGDSNLIYNANKNLFRVYVLVGEDGHTGRFNRFVINTYNFKKEKIMEILLAIGISLLVGVFLLVGQEIFKKEK